MEIINTISLEFLTLLVRVYAKYKYSREKYFHFIDCQYWRILNPSTSCPCLCPVRPIIPPIQFDKNKILPDVYKK